jgi:phosphopantetheinyl transferase
MTHPCVDRPALSIGEVHVWTARLVDEHRATADLLPILSRVRQILSNYSDADAATLTFARNHHGKPYLIPRVNDPNLQFSVSRSSNCCMLAVRLDHSIGIDVEKVRDLPQAADIVQSYFTPAESRALAAYGAAGCILCFADAQGGNGQRVRH